jgi:dTDP-4-dehydrorhamnose 3,5-epimerase
MIFKETKLKGSFVIDLERIEDGRGIFARSWCQKQFAEHGLDLLIVQCNVSYNKKKGTLRGMHYQAAPYEEAKIVHCISGAIYDVIIDLRRESATYCQWFAVESSSDNCRMLYVPVGFAHGFQTLKDNTVVFYQMGEFYHPECARGVKWDDRAFGIKWPLKNRIISAKDSQFPDFIR